MFCPKCGNKNPEDGKFCRSCGVDLTNVSAALNGSLQQRSPGLDDDMMAGMGVDNWFDSSMTEPKDAQRRTDPNEVFGDGVKSIISGAGFLIVSLALLFTGVAGGRVWWWAMLFPAFTFFAKGISDILKTRRMEKSRLSSASVERSFFSRAGETTTLPPVSTDYAQSKASRFETGDLVPPSVTDSTTKLLDKDVKAQAHSFGRDRQ